MDYLSIKETSVKTAIAPQLLTQYGIEYQDYLECVCSPDRKEIFFTEEDLGRLTQIHDMCTVLKFGKDEVLTALDNLQTPEEQRSSSDLGDKEAAVLTRDAIVREKIPQSPFEKKLFRVLELQNKMADLVATKVEHIENLEMKQATVSGEIADSRDQFKKMLEVASDDLHREIISTRAELDEQRSIAENLKKKNEFLEKKIGDILRVILSLRADQLKSMEDFNLLKGEHGKQKKANEQLSLKLESALKEVAEVKACQRKEKSRVSAVKPGVSIHKSSTQNPAPVRNLSLVKPDGTTPSDASPSSSAFSSQQIAGLKDWMQRVNG